MRFRSIRWRLVASYMLLAVLAVSLVGVLSVTIVGNSLQQQEADALRANGEAIAHQVVTRLGSHARLADLQQLAEAAALLGNSRVRVLDANKQTVLADSGPRDQYGEVMWIEPETGEVIGIGKSPLSGTFILLPSGKRINLPPDLTITSIKRIEGPWGSQLIFSGKTGQDPASLPEQPVPEPSGLIVTVPVAVGSGDKPLAYVELSGGPDFSSKAVATTQSAFVWAALIAALAAAVVGFVVSRGLTAPLAGLAKAANQMSGGDLSARAPVQGADELAQLGEQFNQMAGKLQSSFGELAAERDALRRFIADASHELRTPITALQTFNDLVSESAAEDPAARASFLAESQKQIDRLEWITRNLLDLSRLDAGLEALDIAPQDAGELARAAAATFEPLAKEKSITLSMEVPAEPLEVTCDRGRIEMALGNLLQNAIKFTPDGGWVHLAVERAQDAVRWSVTDSGPGIPADDLPHIFERFYRGRHAHVEGSGLGLAIVQSVALAHGGQVTAGSLPEGGSRFALMLPAGKPGEKNQSQP